MMFFGSLFAYFSASQNEGLDIFKSHYDRETEFFSVPANLGMPINSSRDDAYMMWDSRLSKGFFSSDREPCVGGSCYDIYEVVNEPIHIYLSGYSYNKDTEEILPNVKLAFKDVRGVFPPYNIVTDSNGYYEKELSYGVELFIKGQKINYFADATTLKTIERANPSIVILEKGTITQKVHHNDIDKLKL